MAFDEGVKTKKMSRVGGGGRDQNQVQGERAREKNSKWRLDVSDHRKGRRECREFEGEIIRGCGDSTAELYPLTTLLWRDTFSWLLSYS